MCNSHFDPLLSNHMIHTKQRSQGKNALSIFFFSFLKIEDSFLFVVVQTGINKNSSFALHSQLKFGNDKSNGHKEPSWAITHVRF